MQRGSMIGRPRRRWRCWWCNGRGYDGQIHVRGSRTREAQYHCRWSCAPCGATQTEAGASNCDTRAMEIAWFCVGPQYRNSSIVCRGSEVVTLAWAPMLGSGAVLNASRTTHERTAAPDVPCDVKALGAPIRARPLAGSTEMECPNRARWRYAGAMNRRNGPSIPEWLGDDALNGPAKYSPVCACPGCQWRECSAQDQKTTHSSAERLKIRTRSESQTRLG